MTPWQDFGDEEEYEDDRPAVTLGELRDGEGLTLTVDAEPEEFHSDQYGPGVRADCTFVASDYKHENDDGDEVEEGDPCTLVTWSKRLVRNLSNAADENGGIVGETVEIEKFTGGGRYDTQYTVSVRNDD